MNIFKKVKNIVQARYKHWNETNGTVINDLYYGVESLPPKIQFIFKEFIVNSSLLVNMLLGPDERQEEKVFDLDLKLVSKKQFRQLHVVLLISSVATFQKLNPEFEDILTNNISQLIGKNVTENKLYQFIINLEKADLSTIASEVLDYILEILETNSTQSGLSYLFISYYGIHNKQAFQEINQYISQQP